jgi:hypothetical protein
MKTKQEEQHKIREWAAIQSGSPLFSVGTLFGKPTGGGFAFWVNGGLNKKDDTGGTFYRSTGIGSAMASGRMPL